MDGETIAASVTSAPMSPDPTPRPPIPSVPVRGTVVVATYNSARSVGAVLAEIEEAASVLARSGIDLDVVIADDHSPDGTASLAREQAERLGLQLQVIHVPMVDRSAGLVAGIQHVLTEHPDRDLIVTLDADGRHDARQITDLVRVFLARRRGLVIGSRWVSGGSSPGARGARRLASRLASLSVRTMGGLRRVCDATTSFWVIDPETARTVLADDHLHAGPAFYASFVALTQAYGYGIDEVPITFRPRYSGPEPLSLGEMRGFATNIGPLRRRCREVRADNRADQAAWARRSGRLADQDAAVGSEFGADAELEVLADAERFIGWIADELTPHIGRRTLEVGAGLGTTSLALADRRPNTDILAIEPDTRLYDELVLRTKRAPGIRTALSTSTDLAATPDAAGAFDSVVYVNVLEHILDDAGELATARSLLTPGGTLAIFVPAMPRLYGSLDFKSGHHRRYTADGLRSVIAGAGFDVVDVRYFDVLGAAPYYVMYRLLDVSTLGSMSSQGYDRVVVPVSRALQRLVPHPPLGKNLLAIARRPPLG